VPEPGRRPSIAQTLDLAAEQLGRSGVMNAKREATALWAALAGVKPGDVWLRREGEPERLVVERFWEAVERRASGFPFPYAVGRTTFRTLDLKLDPRALIPRPETESLVELALARVRGALSAAPRPAGTRPFRVLDVGTGSGAVVVALARTLRRTGYGEAVRFTASDRSQDALALAVENAVSHGVADLIDFRVADLLDPAIEVDGPIDLVVANLPYIPSAVLPQLPVAASFEPREALDGGSDGLDLVRRLLEDLPRVLAVGGGALLEIGADQGEAAIAATAERVPGWPATIHPDLAGQPRVLSVERPGR
jgi:release factor glutamine methyltransferase